MADDPPECKRCNCTMTIPFDLEPTDYCNPCAQALVVEQEEAIEQLRVQLAGCGVAALGGTAERGQVAEKGSYGWSQSYQDVLELRIEVERLRPREAELIAVLEQWLAYAETQGVNVAAMRAKMLARAGAET